MSNHLLSSLPAEEYARIQQRLERITLEYGTTFLDPGDEIGWVYFPNSGIISMLAEVEDGSTLISCVVGREGVAGGLPLFLGGKEAPARAVIQGTGTAMRMTAADFKQECENGGALPRMLMHFTYSILVQILQSSACYRFHPVEKRLARWLLMTSDRMKTNEFYMTQAFLANMVGVRRETVTAAAGMLKEKGMISYNRGEMVIADRHALRAAACNCYTIISNEEKRYLNATKTTGAMVVQQRMSTNGRG